MHAFHINAFDHRMHSCRRHRHRRRGGGAPRRDRRESAGDQPLHAYPEAAIFPNQRLQLFPVAAEKYETVTSVRLVAQFVLDHARQRVDPPPHVLWVASHVDPPHGRETQHGRRRQARAVASRAPAKSGGIPAVNEQRSPLRVVRIRWRRRRRPRRGCGWTTSSMKPGMPTSCGGLDERLTVHRTDTLRPTLRRLGVDLCRQDHDRRRHRSPRPPRHHAGIRHGKLSEARSGRSRTAAGTLPAGSARRRAVEYPQQWRFDENAPVNPPRPTERAGKDSARRSYELASQSWQSSCRKVGNLVVGRSAI